MFFQVVVNSDLANNGIIVPRVNTVLGYHKSLLTFLPININLVLCVFLFKEPCLVCILFVHSLTLNSWPTVLFSSVTQSCLTLCDPMNCSMPGLPVHHQLLESTQTHVHWVDDAIQPSHPLSSLSPPVLNLSQHQGLFKRVNSLHQVAKVLEFQLQNQSWIVTGRTNVEAETTILWPPDAKNWLIWKDPDAGKDWRQEEKGTTEDKMVGWHHRFNRRVWVNSVSWLWTGRPGVLQSMELQGVGHDWATELNWLNFESPLDILDTSHLLNISANNFCLWLVFPLNRVLLRTKHFYFLQV